MICFSRVLIRAALGGGSCDPSGTYEPNGAHDQGYMRTEVACDGEGADVIGDEPPKRTLETTTSGGYYEPRRGCTYDRTNQLVCRAPALTGGCVCLIWPWGLRLSGPRLFLNARVQVWSSRGKIHYGTDIFRNPASGTRVYISTKFSVFIGGYGGLGTDECRDKWRFGSGF